MEPIYKAQGQSIYETYALISAMQDAVADHENYIRRFSHGEIMAERRWRLDRERGAGSLKSPPLPSSKFAPTGAEYVAAG